MVLNREKTKIMLITTKQRRIHLSIEELSLNYNDEQLNVISDDKILGVYVDNNLIFSGHIKIKKDNLKYMATFKNQKVLKCRVQGTILQNIHTATP